MNLPRRNRKYLLKITIGQCHPYLLYMKILNPSHHSCQHANQTMRRANINQYQKHIPSVFCYHIKCFDDTLYSQQPITFVKEFNDDDVALIFIDALEKNINEIYKKFKFSKSMIMALHDKMVYDNSTLCHICNEELGKDRVRDHFHLSGKFRGAAHEVCNLKCKVRKFLSVVFYNLSGYDSHLFIKTLGIAKEIFLAYQIMKKTIFLSRNRSSLTNLLTRKETGKCKARVKIYRQLEINDFKS